MKLKYLFLVVLFSISFGHAQESENVNKESSSEIKLNALYLVLGAFEGTYEYLLNEESGLGISVFLPIDSEVNDDINYYISPYYRFYFGNKYAAGFFLEGFGLLNSVNESTYYYTGGIDPSIEKEKVTDFALGIGLGGKWITKRGLLGEISLGIGRNLFNSSDIEDSEFVGKVGITIGYRF